VRDRRGILTPQCEGPPRAIRALPRGPRARGPAMLLGAMPKVPLGPGRRRARAARTGTFGRAPASLDPRRDEGGHQPSAPAQRRRARPACGRCRNGELYTSRACARKHGPPPPASARHTDTELLPHLWLERLAAVKARRWRGHCAGCSRCAMHDTGRTARCCSREMRGPARREAAQLGRARVEPANASATNPHEPLVRASEI
jgi:hypothetical protein